MNLAIHVSFAIIVTAAAKLTAAQPQPVHSIGPAQHVSIEPLSSVAQVRVLVDGRVIVHDLTGRRVVLLDSTLKKIAVIADSTSATGNAYASRLGGLIAYRADSTLFVDPQSLSMLLIDPQGKIVRAIAVPLPNEVNQLIGGQNGTPGFDAQGRLVYRAQLRPPARLELPAPGETTMPQPPESSLVVRVDLKTRRVDTAATYRIPKIKLTITRDETTGGVELKTTANPLPWTDDWALLADGSLAIVRGQDYRVDIVRADGTMISGPKLPFDWQRLSDDDKKLILDSTRVALDALRSTMIAQQQRAAGRDPTAAAETGAASKRLLTQADGGATNKLTGAGVSAAGFLPPPPPVYLISPSEMPDYRPAFRQGAARGDADGNLWIRTSRVVQGGAVYDVINGKGELTDRVLVPPGRVIAGFGAGGVVYMGVVDGSGARVERARTR